MIRVLIADDQELVVRTGLRTLLEVEPDIEVVAEATNGRRALAEVAATSPDVVLMDVRMPGDGRHCCDRPRCVNPEARSRVCVLTTFGLEEYVYDALNAGACGFLVKTDNAEMIVATVRAVAAGEFALGTETTAQLVARFAAGRRPSRGGRPSCATDTARAGGLLPHGPGPVQRADRTAVVRGGGNGQDPRVLASS